MTAALPGAVERHAKAVSPNPHGQVEAIARRENRGPLRTSCLGDWLANCSNWSIVTLQRLDGNGERVRRGAAGRRWRRPYSSACRTASISGPR